MCYAAAAGFGIQELGETGRGIEVASSWRSRVADRAAEIINAGLGEQAGEFDRGMSARADDAFAADRSPRS